MANISSFDFIDEKVIKLPRSYICNINCCQIQCYGTIRILYACSQCISWPLCVGPQYLRYTCVLFFSPAGNDPKKKREESPVYEQGENVDNPLRCPVKLYEFYLSKWWVIHSLPLISIPFLRFLLSFCYQRSKLIATFLTLICEFKCDHTVSMKLIIDTPFCTPAFEDEPQVVRVAQGMELEQNIIFEKIYFGWT